MRKRCNRKVRQLVNPIQWAIDGVSLPSPQQIADLRVRELSSLEALRNGTGTLEDVKDLTDVMNLCETLASMGIGPEAMPAVEKAHGAFLAIKRRIDKWGKVQVMPEELEALAEVQAYLDLQRQSVDRATILKATTLCFNRIRGAHPSVKEWI
jgi:hypothetical protein